MIYANLNLDTDMFKQTHAKHNVYLALPLYVFIMSDQQTKWAGSLEFISFCFNSMSFFCYYN